jgi:hypothetical protein
MIHFGHWGRENLASLTSKDFAVKQDSDGALYVDKTTDEQTKNHQMDHQKSSDGCMYEIKGKKYILNNLKKYTNIVTQE